MPGRSSKRRPDCASLSSPEESGPGTIPNHCAPQYSACVVDAIRQGDIPGIQIRCRQVLALPAEEAWRWLTEPEFLRRWLAEEVSAAAEVGGFLELATKGEAWRERGETIEVRRPYCWLLSFRRLDGGWPVATRLRLEIATRPQGSEVSALHTGFQDLQLSTCLTVWEEYRRRWRGALARLAEVSRPASAP